MGTYTNFGVVVGQIVGAYKRDSYTWSVESFANVFRAFYTKHREKTGTDHPRLRTDTISQIMHALEVDENGTQYSEQDTLLLIDQYYADDLDCDYSIAHFVSGQIRAIREAELMFHC